MHNYIVQPGQQLCNSETDIPLNENFNCKSMERNRLSASSNSSPYTLNTDQIDGKHFQPFITMTDFNEGSAFYDSIKPEVSQAPPYNELCGVQSNALIASPQDLHMMLNPIVEGESTPKLSNLEAMHTSENPIEDSLNSDSNTAPKHQISIDLDGDKPKLKRKYTRRVKPMLKELEIPSDNIIRGSWTVEEDSHLATLIEENGPTKWVTIAKALGTRTGKQCRERWHNHLDPNILKTPFTPEEDKTIVKLYNQFGAKWATMSKMMPGRPDNAIKNHFNTFLYPRRIHLKNQQDRVKPVKKEKAMKPKKEKVKKEPKISKVKQPKQNKKLVAKIEASNPVTTTAANNATYYNTSLNNQLLNNPMHNYMFTNNLSNLVPTISSSMNSNKLSLNAAIQHNALQNLQSLNPLQMYDNSTTTSASLQPYIYTSQFANMYNNNMYNNSFPTFNNEDEDMKMILNLSNDLGINLSHY